MWGGWIGSSDCNDTFFRSFSREVVQVTTIPMKCEPIAAYRTKMSLK